MHQLTDCNRHHFCNCIPDILYYHDHPNKADYTVVLANQRCTYRYQNDDRMMHHFCNCISIYSPYQINLQDIFHHNEFLDIQQRKCIFQLPDYIGNRYLGYTRIFSCNFHHNTMSDMENYSLLPYNQHDNCRNQ